MPGETRDAREARIHEAAYRLLAERGYAGASMLSIAKAAKASNETLYRWYGDKRGLFARLVAGNADAIRRELAAALAAEDDPLTSLERIAPLLLAMLLGEKAVMLNRAAASDETGELGAAIAAHGRESVAPLVEQLLGRAIEAGLVAAPGAGKATEWFLSLLIGDLQVRRVIRVLPEPGDDEIRARAQDALAAFLRLCRA